MPGDSVRSPGDRTPRCPECGLSNNVATNPVVDDSYECGSCLIAFNGDGEVVARE